MLKSKKMSYVRDIFKQFSYKDHWVSDDILSGYSVSQKTEVSFPAFTDAILAFLMGA